ncbi:Fic family protein [Pseudomonas fluorescens]|uniref:Fic family protein n=1 Tax=Pseudomonas fluorescens TaxID=294 RepID=UPI001782C4D7|nr:Fic family protein [Pseudomonas fluorescens]
MILFELCGNNEQDPIYQGLEVSNNNRQYDFLKSIVGAALATQRPFLSTHIIKALNFHAITCLHTNAGEYRPCPVYVGNHTPPDHYRVEALMDDLVNMVNRNWEQSDPVTLAAYVLWRLNHIHPFINGNGRTARAACYFVLCVKSGSWLPGTTILPELIRRDRQDYIDALRLVDASLAQGAVDLSPLHVLLSKLITEQLSTQP